MKIISPRVSALSAFLLLAACASNQAPSSSAIAMNAPEDVERHIGILPGENVNGAVVAVTAKAKQGARCHKAGELANTDDETPYMLHCVADGHKRLRWQPVDLMKLPQAAETGAGCPRSGDIAVSPGGGLMWCGEDPPSQTTATSGGPR